MTERPWDEPQTPLAPVSIPATPDSPAQVTASAKGVNDDG